MLNPNSPPTNYQIHCSRFEIANAQILIHYPFKGLKKGFTYQKIIKLVYNLSSSHASKTDNQYKPCLSPFQQILVHYVPNHEVWLSNLYEDERRLYICFGSYCNHKRSHKL